MTTELPLRRKSIKDRRHLAHVGDFGKPAPPGASFAEWLESLPDFLAVKSLRALVEAVVSARRAGAPFMVAMGAHVIKTGCAPLLIDLMRRGLLTGLAMHNAGAIHDFEIALHGETSEDVNATLRDGSFGMIVETPSAFGEAARDARARGVGLGRAVGELINRRGMPHRGASLLAVAAELGLPATVHVAFGTDTIHVHPEIDGADLGAATQNDLRLLAAEVERLEGPATGPGGVWLNIGSAVILPEVFLKVVGLARHRGRNLDRMVAANFDMISHYRTRQNVVGRPTPTGFNVIGHHELLIPLFRQMLVEAWERAGKAVS
jgi:hypothetical protein